MDKILFLNVGWMKSYQGLWNDRIKGGGAYVQEHGYGHEIFNFKPYEGYLYGFVQVKGLLNIERLGAKKNDNFVENVLVIWVAREPVGGTVIIGWYNNATVYGKLQPPPKGSNREYHGEELGYWIKAKETGCKLLPVDQRVIAIPRKEKGGMGQANVWYADQPVNEPFREKVWNFVKKGGVLSSKQSQPKKGRAWQPDPYKRNRVEKKAIELTVAHYTHLGYSVGSVEKDNMGWDLEATLNDKMLRLETKGLSQRQVLIEFTPNEYDKMKKYRDSYRICVVTDALGEQPLLRIFAFSPDRQNWEDADGNSLMINEVVSARMSVV